MSLTKYSFRIKYSKRYNYSLVKVNNFDETKIKFIFKNLDEDSAQGLLYAIDLGWISENKLLKKTKKYKKERKGNK